MKVKGNKVCIFSLLSYIFSLITWKLYLIKLTGIYHHSQVHFDSIASCETSAEHHE